MILLQLHHMPSLHPIITAINFLGLIYLIFLFYEKNNKIGKKSLSGSQLADQIKKLDPFPPKISLTRFNPFDNVGGDQSFILVLLDNVNSGVIITSLHNRNNTRIYAKQIKNGKSVDATFSIEEKNAVTKTIKINKK